MSKRCKLQKEYYKEFGNYKGSGKYTDHHVNWLEMKVSQALILTDVSQQRELLDLLTEIANSDTLYSNTRHRMIARKLLKSNCG